MVASQGASQHVPVLYEEALSGLQLRSGRRMIDGTLGAGGHAEGILDRSSPEGELLGLDLDPTALAIAQDRLAKFKGRVHLRRASYGDMRAQAEALGWEHVDGILLDLGVSSLQLQDAARGFSFRLEGPLDMRFDPGSGITAETLVNELGVDELADLLARFGEEPHAWRVAKAIVTERPIHGTLALARIIVREAGRPRPGIHPATRTFQALRIAVNNELETLESALPVAGRLLARGGRLVVIAFHSLEDRVVKEYFRRESRDCLCPPTQPVCTCGHRASLRLVHRKPLRPSEREGQANPRARSARLRVAERT